MHIHIAWVVGYYFFSAAVSSLPDPTGFPAWYSFLYKFANTLSANADKMGLFKRNGNGAVKPPQ